ncbi:MAG: hypothetical protein K8U57_18000 [Planctomycetes bacterium]|nr:hypothetical protein [Planctomycetota bacterium]
MGKFIDLTEQDFESWHVLHRDDTRPEKVAYWVCRCKCGTVSTVRGQYLRDGRSPHCKKCADKGRGAVPRYKPGKKIGSWTILRRNKHAAGYVCRCECGFEAVRQIGNLGGGKTSGCKSCWRKRLAAKGRKPRRKLTDRTVWSVEQLSLLGTDTDQAVAEKLGRTEEAVRLKRSRLKIPLFNRRS